MDGHSARAFGPLGFSQATRKLFPSRSKSNDWVCPPPREAQRSEHSFVKAGLKRSLRWNEPRSEPRHSSGLSDSKQGGPWMLRPRTRRNWCAPIRSEDHFAVLGVGAHKMHSRPEWRA